MLINHQAPISMASAFKLAACCIHGLLSTGQGDVDSLHMLELLQLIGNLNVVVKR